MEYRGPQMHQPGICQLRRLAVLVLDQAPGCNGDPSPQPEPDTTGVKYVGIVVSHKNGLCCPHEKVAIRDGLWQFGTVRMVRRAPGTLGFGAVILDDPIATRLTHTFT
jgi:hypothetical protein